MNTPRQVKRYKRPPFNKDIGGTFSLNCSNPDYAMRLSRIVSEFVHLEETMVMILGVLLGAEDDTMAGYVYRAVLSPRGRVDLMRNLLRLAPHNRNLPEVYDYIIDEFWALNQQRNNYAHGEWYTKDDGSVYIIEFDEHGAGLFSNKVRQVTLEEMDSVLERMHLHYMRIQGTAGPEFVRRRQQKGPHPESPEQAPEPSS